MPHQTPSQKGKRKGSGNTPQSAKRETKKIKEADDTMDEISMLEQSVENIREQLISLKQDIDAKDKHEKEDRGESSRTKLDHVVQSIEFLTASVEEMKKALEETRKDIAEVNVLKEEIYCVKVQNQILSERITSQEDYSRRDNMIVSGLKENRDEVCRKVAIDFLKEAFNMDNVDIVRTHRLGGGDHHRKLIIRFKNHADKEHVMKNRRVLKDKKPGVYVDDDFSQETARRRGSLLPVLRELKKIDPKAHLRGDKIFSRGRLYSHRQLYDLPIDPHVACTESSGEVTVFSGTYSKLSNLYFHPFDLEGRQWHSVEHYYQHSKALAAGDSNAAREIRMTTDPLEAMARGKPVKPGPSWEKDGPMIMKKAQRAKFAIPPLGLALRNTKKTIAEGTRNGFWGIGIAKNNRDCFVVQKWTGKNMAGETLMQIREEIGYDKKT